MIANRRSVSIVYRNAHSHYQYKKVLDGRKQPIRGLWERNGKLIARLSVENDAGQKETLWVALEDAETVAQAQDKLKTFHVDRARHDLSVLERTSNLPIMRHNTLETMKDAKRPSTIEKERGAINLSSTTKFRGGRSRYPVICVIAASTLQSCFAQALRSG
ncbi:MAG: hypothetical protein P4N60_02290 [Verrucomicrobiae bacterium]|nr:hypothetical protein [Verrucomicrobiae bacterium]